MNTISETLSIPKDPRSHTDEKDSGHGCAWGCCAGSGPGRRSRPAQPQPSATAAQASAQAQPPAPPAQAPVIKDPAEYNAYVGAIQQKDPTAQISGLEAFLTQYPNSVMKIAGAANSDAGLPADGQPAKDDGHGHQTGGGRSLTTSAPCSCWLIRSPEGARRRPQCQAGSGRCQEVRADGTGWSAEVHQARWHVGR